MGVIHKLHYFAADSLACYDRFVVGNNNNSNGYPKSCSYDDDVCVGITGLRHDLFEGPNNMSMGTCANFEQLKNDLKDKPSPVTEVNEIEDIKLGSCNSVNIENTSYTICVCNTNLCNTANAQYENIVTTQPPPDTGKHPDIKSLFS